MRAAVLEDTERGPVPGEFEEPRAEEDGQLVVDLSVAGVKPVDIWTAKGVMGAPPPLPSVAGGEGLGTTGDGLAPLLDPLWGAPPLAASYALAMNRLAVLIGNSAGRAIELSSRLVR